MERPGTADELLAAAERELRAPGEAHQLGGDLGAAGAEVVAALRACLPQRLYLTRHELHEALVRRLHAEAKELRRLSTWGRKAVLEAALDECVAAIEGGGWIYAATVLYETLGDLWPALGPPVLSLRELLGTLNPDTLVHLQRIGVEPDARDLLDEGGTAALARILPVRIKGNTAPSVEDVARKITREVLIAYGVQPKRARASLLRSIEKDRREAETDESSR
jgi:hypothetical protein